MKPLSELNLEKLIIHSLNRQHMIFVLFCFTLSLVVSLSNGANELQAKTTSGKELQRERKSFSYASKIYFTVHRQHGVYFKIFVNIPTCQMKYIFLYHYLNVQPYKRNMIIRIKKFHFIRDINSTIFSQLVSLLMKFLTF